MQLRKRTPVPVDHLKWAFRGTSELDPAHVIDSKGRANAVRQALFELSPVLQEVTMLRYFTAVTSYEEISRVCAIPDALAARRLVRAAGTLSSA